MAEQPNQQETVPRKEKKEKEVKRKLREEATSELSATPSSEIQHPVKERKQKEIKNKLSKEELAAEQLASNLVPHQQPKKLVRKKPLVGVNRVGERKYEFHLKTQRLVRLSRKNFDIDKWIYLHEDYLRYKLCNIEFNLNIDIDESHQVYEDFIRLLIVPGTPDYPGYKPPSETDHGAYIHGEPFQYFTRKFKQIIEKIGRQIPDYQFDSVGISIEGNTDEETGELQSHLKIVYTKEGKPNSAIHINIHLQHLIDNDANKALENLEKIPDKFAKLSTSRTDFSRQDKTNLERMEAMDLFNFKDSDFCSQSRYDTFSCHPASENMYQTFQEEHQKASERSIEERKEERKRAKAAATRSPSSVPNLAKPEGKYIPPHIRRFGSLPDISQPSVPSRPSTAEALERKPTPAALLARSLPGAINFNPSNVPRQMSLRPEDILSASDQKADSETIEKLSVGILRHEIVDFCLEIGGDPSKKWLYNFLYGKNEKDPNSLFHKLSVVDDLNSLKIVLTENSQTLAGFSGNSVVVRNKIQAVIQKIDQSLAEIRQEPLSTSKKV